MTWQFPLGFALLGAVPVILWLHRLRRRVPERTVPSLVPWLTLKVAEPMRRRRVPPTVLLALHLAVAALLALATAGPQRRGAAAPSGDVALVVDTSLSMAAGDRWPAARAAAAEVLASATGRITVIELGPRATGKVARTLDRALASAAVDALAPGGVGADVAGALMLAGAVAGDGARVAVVTDGAIGAAQDGGSASAPPSIAQFQRVGWHVVGREPAPPNVAVVGIAAADDASGGARVVAQIGYFGAERAQARVTLVVGGRVIDESTIELEGDTIVPIAWRIAARTGAAEVRALRLGNGGEAVGDALAADDAAGVPLAVRERRVQLAGRSAALRRALAAQSHTRLVEVGLGTLADDGTVDVTVLHDAPATNVPLGGAILVAPRPPDAGRDVGSNTASGIDSPRRTDPTDIAEQDVGRSEATFATAPITGTWQGAAPHPITAGLDLDGARVAGVRAASAPARADVLAFVGGRPAAWAETVAGNRNVVLAFDPDGGTLAEHEAFPVLVGRAIEWASPDLPPATLTAGAPFLLPPWPVSITAPDGRRTLAALRFDETLAPGLYTVRRRRVPRAGIAEAGDVTAVRAGDAAESRLAARSADDLAAAFAPEETAPGGSAAAAGAALSRPLQPVQRWPLVVVLLVLAVEAAWRAAPARRPRARAASAP